MPTLLNFLDLMWDRETDDRHDDHFIRLLHLQCASLIVMY